MLVVLVINFSPLGELNRTHSSSGSHRRQQRASERVSERQRQFNPMRQKWLNVETQRELENMLQIYGALFNRRADGRKRAKEGGRGGVGGAGRERAAFYDHHAMLKMDDTMSDMQLIFISRSNNVISTSRQE